MRANASRIYLQKTRNILREPFTVLCVAEKFPVKKWLNKQQLELSIAPARTKRQGEKGQNMREKRQKRTCVREKERKREKAKRRERSNTNERMVNPSE